MVRRQSIVLSSLALVFGTGILATGSANAAVTVTFAQSGNNVVMTTSGSINTGSLGSPSYAGSGGAHIVPGVGSPFYQTALIEGGSSGEGASVTFTSGPALGFGNGNAGFVSANSDTGKFFGFSLQNSLSTSGLAYPTNSSISLPSGYVSGSPISDTDVFNNTTIAGLGVTTGTETFTFGSGSTADSIIVTTNSSVPEPASLSLLGVGATALLGRRRRIA